MTTPDVSLPKVASTSQGARKSSHLRLVGKGSSEDFAAADAHSSPNGIKTKVAKGKNHAEAKTQDKLAADNASTGPFSALLDQVEKKLSLSQTKAGDSEASVDDKDSEESSDSDSNTSSIRSQNGTTSLFAGAYLMRGWEPVLISPADTPTAVSQSEEKHEPANSNVVRTSSKTVIDSILEKTVGGKSEMASGVKPETTSEAKSIKTADVSPDTTFDAKSATLKLINMPQRPTQAETRASAPTAVPPIQISIALKAETRSQALTSDQSSEDDLRTIADAQAQGVISEIHVTSQHDTRGQMSRDSEHGKDGQSKDQAAASVKVENAVQVTVQAGSVVAASAASQATPASPASQIIERILQELPAQNGIAAADQVAQASKVMMVRLHPEGLGDVMIRISNAGGNLKISLSSEHETTSDELQADSSQLLKALQQVLPSFGSDSLSFSTQDQGSKDAQTNNGAGQNATNGNSTSGQWNEGQGNAEQGGRRVPGQRSQGRLGQGSGDAQVGPDTGRGQRGGSIYL